MPSFNVVIWEHSNWCSANKVVSWGAIPTGVDMFFIISLSVLLLMGELQYHTSSFCSCNFVDTSVGHWNRACRLGFRYLRKLSRVFTKQRFEWVTSNIFHFLWIASPTFPSCIICLQIPYLLVYKSTFYDQKINPKNRPRLIHESYRKTWPSNPRN